MKKTVSLLLFSILLVNCKNASEEKTYAEEDVQTVTGEFIYMADAAVLKGDTFIYGVKLDEKSEELADKVAPIKNEEFDMVEVTVKGVVNPKAQDQEGWDEILTITEIISVSDKPAEADIKIQDKNS